MAIQILGQDGATVQKIDASFGASRVALRPAEVTSWLSIGAQSGNLSALAANTAVFSLRNLSANLLMIRRVGVGFITTTAFTIAQKIDFGLMVARAFTVSDTAGTAIALVGTNAKHRTSLGTLTSVDCRVAAAAALGAGTKTLDTNHLGQTGGWSGAAGITIQPAQDNLLQHSAGDYPVILAQNEGINIMNLTAMGAVGVGVLYVNLEVAECVSY